MLLLFFCNSVSPLKESITFNRHKYDKEIRIKADEVALYPSLYNVRCSRCFQFRSFTNSYLVDEMNRDGYRDQIVTRLHIVMWVCLCIHCSCRSVLYPSLFPILFLQSL